MLHSDPVSSESIHLMATRTHRPNVVVDVKQAGSPGVLSHLARAEYRALLNGMTHARSEKCTAGMVLPLQTIVLMDLSTKLPSFLKQQMSCGPTFSPLQRISRVLLFDPPGRMAYS